MKLLFGPLSILIVGISVEMNVIAQHNNLLPRHELKCDVNFKLLSHETRTFIANNYNYITLFTDIDCQGDSITFNTSILSSSIAFTNKIIRETTVSFKPTYNNDYDSSVQKFRLEKRLPSYFLWRNFINAGEPKVVSLNSGKCTNITLPRKRGGDPNEVIPWGGTILSFCNTDCEGEGNIFSSFTMSTYRLSDMVKSVRVLSNLEFRTPCQSPCPTFLYSGSEEYEFWDHLFSIYNETYRKIFKERVKQSTNGFISWDFLFPAENVSSAPNSTLDTRSYLDAIRSTMHLFTFLCSRKIGELGFTRDSIIFLESQSLKIARERRSQHYHHNDYNGHLLKNFSSIWSLMKDKLEALNSTCWVKVLHGNKESRFVGRQNYPVTFQYAQRPRENLFLTNDDCKTLPSELQNRHVDKVSPNDDCFILYEQVDCGGPKHWAIELNNIDKRDRLKPILRNDKTIKSVRVCDLSFNHSCSSCPDKFLYIGSSEYTFWEYFFRINPPSPSDQKTKFKEQVDGSSNSGYISWDFLNGNKINQSLGLQYRTAFDNLFHILRKVQASSPQVTGFNTKIVGDLQYYATSVLSERKKQAEKVDKEWSDSNIATMEQLISIWISILDILDLILTNWRVDPFVEEICGIVRKNKDLNRPKDPNRKGREMANYGDDPWHAAIYVKSEKERSGPKLICGATLISPSVLVSAAHCFYHETSGTERNNTEDYTIVLGKFTSNYFTEDHSQETRKIKELVSTSKKYDPNRTGNKGSDIILIILEKPVAFNSHIRPACVDWNNTIFGSSTLNNKIGRFVGWGTPHRDSVSENLTTADIPYINFNDCKNVMYLTNDKFCAGFENGTNLGAKHGDSGGGLMFEENDRYYVYGVVSTANGIVDNSVTAFTELMNYKYWISNYVKN